MKWILLAVLVALASACAHLPAGSSAGATSGGTPTGTPTATGNQTATGDQTPTASAPATPSTTATPTPPAAPTPPASSTPKTAPPITIVAVGDVMLGSSYPDSEGGLLPPDDGKELLAEVTPLLSAADIAFANLEGPLLDSGVSEKCARSRPGRCYAFRVPTRYARLLQAAGLDVVSLANNHVGDFGEAGRASTRAALDGVGIRYSGAPGEVARLEVRGSRVAIVAFATSAGVNDLRDLGEAARIVREAKAAADVVVVSMHGGGEGADRQHVPPGREEFLGEDRGDLRAFARTVIGAGADLVIGHGPHVVRGMEVMKGRLVAYSLGNFATYGGMNLSGPNGLTLVLEVQLAPDGTFLGGKIHPARQERPGGPKLDPAATIVPLVRRLSAEDFGVTAVRVADDGTIAPPQAPVAAARLLARPASP